MNTLVKGDIAEKKFELLCIEKSIDIFKPVNSGNVIDYIIILNGIPQRVQIKYCTKRNGKIEMCMYKNSFNSKSSKRRFYTTARRDLFLVLCDDIWYNIPITAKEQKCIILRITHPKNNQKNGVKLAENYMLNW